MKNPFVRLRCSLNIIFLPRCFTRNITLTNARTLCLYLKRGGYSVDKYNYGKGKNLCQEKKGVLSNFFEILYNLFRVLQLGVNI